MLKAEILDAPKGRVIRLFGTLDDASQIEQAFGKPAAVNWVDCGGIHRINSTGIKGWIIFFRKLAEAGVPVKFINCSPAIVEQLNIFFGFEASGSVESLQVPFICKADHQFTVEFTTSALRESSSSVASRACPQCGAAAEFDDIPSEYFGFLMANKAQS